MREFNDFKNLCSKIYDDFSIQWNSDSTLLEKSNILIKESLRGTESAVCEFKELIEKYLKNNNRENVEYPEYYTDLVDAVYHENWGMAGMAEWFTDKHEGSSSAKIVGNRIYFLIDGTITLMPQKIDSVRKNQLIAKLLSIKPDERRDKDTHEIYLIDGTRVTIYNDSLVKEVTIVFRKYIVKNYTLEELARLGTFPNDSVKFLSAMVKLKYNISLNGPVGTGKTTALATWQAKEDVTSEGVMVETDPEIPLHKIMPEAPIIQFVADTKEKLEEVVKKILRSDCDYIIMAEARDGIALNTLVRVANKGNRQCKSTFHNRKGENYVIDAASEIISVYGGELWITAERVAEAINYVFQFVKLQDKRQKRLEGIYELRVDKENGDIYTTQICKYNYSSNTWSWKYHISDTQRMDGIIANAEAFREFDEELRRLSEESEKPEFPFVKTKVNYRGGLNERVPL